METIDAIQAKNSGLSLEEHMKSIARRKALMPKAKKIQGTSPTEWPKLNFNWDLSIEGRRYSFDKPVFLPSEQDIPRAMIKWKKGLRDFELGWVVLTEMDSVLCHFSRRNGPKELWSLGNSSKLAFVIAHVSEGLPISPPVVKPHSEGGIILNGGHHRYAAAKAVGVEIIPIYCLSANRNRIDELLSVKWVNKC